MTMFDQLSLVWQVWAAMLLGAVLLMLGLFVGIEWRWICASTRRAWSPVATWLRLTFTAAGDDPSPQTDASIARAKATQAFDRRAYHVDEDGHVRRRRGLSEIHRATADNAQHGEVERRRQLLSACESSPASSPFRKGVH